METPSTPLPVKQEIGPLLALLLIRIWLGMRSFMAGIEKFAGYRDQERPVIINGEVNDYGLTDTVARKVYGLTHYDGIPDALFQELQKEPLLPQFILTGFDMLLGPLLILLGLTVLLGIAIRVSLFVMGLIYTLLTAGLILIQQDAGVAWLAVHTVLIVIALLNIRYNRFVLWKKG